MIRTAAELKAAIEAAARAAPRARHVFRIGDGLGPLGVRNAPFTGRGGVVIEGGSLDRIGWVDSGALTLRRVGFSGAAGGSAGRRSIFLRFAADATLLLDRVRMEGKGEAEALPVGVLVDRASRVRAVGSVFRALFNGLTTATVPLVEALGCDFRRIIGDAIALRGADPARLSRVRLVARDNLMTDVHETEITHSDAIQAGLKVPLEVEITGNVVWSPGRTMQGFFLQTHAEGVIARNHLLIRSGNAVYAWAPRGLAVLENVVATEVSEDPGPGNPRGARIFGRSPGMAAAGNVAAAVHGPVRDEGRNLILPRGAHRGALRGPWVAGEWGDALASPPPLDAPARVVKAALRRALSRV